MGLGLPDAGGLGDGLVGLAVGVALAVPGGLVLGDGLTLGAGLAR